MFQRPYRRSGSLNSYLSRWSFGLTDSKSFSPLIKATVTIDQFQSIKWEAQLGILMKVDGGRARSTNGRTFTLERIQFPDGTTPEELGSDLVFDSGMVSPNIAREGEAAADFDRDGDVDGADFPNLAAKLRHDVFSVSGRWRRKCRWRR